MKPVALLAVVLAVGVATYSAAAWSAAPTSPTEKQLLKQVKTLQSQVKTLQKSDKRQNTAIGQIAGFAALGAEYSICSTALTADAVQGTWEIVDQIAAATQAGKNYFGTQTPVSDSLPGLTTPVCQDLKVTRSQALPPTAGQFDTLISVFR